MKRCGWVKPVLVAQVKFTEWTHANQLRQPVFLGLRNDKEAKNVIHE
jgi:bifunctional non-homologous end joining protein LigD